MKVFLDVNDRVVTIPTNNGTIDLAWIQANREDLAATQEIASCPSELVRYEPMIMNVTTDNKNYHVKTSGDGSDISHYTLTDDLRCAKLAAEDIIDANTYKLIRGPQKLGFQWNGVYFSMSSWGQLNLIGLHLAGGAAGFPMDWSVHDLEGNYATYSIADATEAQNIYFTGLGRKKSIMVAGSAAKVAIEAAVDQAGIDAAVATDTRVYADYP